MKIINDSAINYLIRQDPVFQKIISRYGFPPSWKRPEGFETLCRIIIEQQVSLDSGKATFEKLASRVKTFDPVHIMNLTKADLREVTVSRQKAGYIQGLAQLILDGKLHLASLRHQTYEESLSSLTSVKGIGPWTAEVYLLFALQSPDIYPRGDIALINTIKELWNIENAQKAMQKAMKWSPYRSTASYLLWHYYLSKRGRISPD